MNNHTIKFNVDVIQGAYDKSKEIYNELEGVFKELKEKSESAEELMKGNYKKAYHDKSEEIFDDFEKETKKIASLSKCIDSVSKDFLGADMKISDSIKK